MEILAPKSLNIAMPAKLYKLRWIMELTDGKKFVSSWLPETRFPSIEMTTAYARDKLKRVIIEGQHLYTNELKSFLVCGENLFHRLSYKGFMSVSSGRSFTGGIEVECIDGSISLVLQDGTIYQEGAKA